MTNVFRGSSPCWILTSGGGINHVKVVVVVFVDYVTHVALVVVLVDIVIFVVDVSVLSVKFRDLKVVRYFGKFPFREPCQGLRVVVIAVMLLIHAHPSSE